MTTRKMLTATLAALVAGGTLAACGGSGGGGGGGGAVSHTLRTAFSADPSPLDPDTYYEAEGLAVTLSAYDRLLKYGNQTTDLQPDLATKWAVSKDGLTYTFTLRTGVKFSDGTAFDAAAAKASLERRTAMKGGPAYMLADVKQITAPSPSQLVVKLTRPRASFLSLLASPYGPMMTSPTAIKAHAVGGDNASKWLATHTAGTGPYVLSSVQPSVRYVLTANPGYWGTKPWYSTVNIAVLPSFSTQRLQLEGGQLDLVLHGLSTQDVTALAQNPKVQVKNFPALFKAEVMMNPASPTLGSATARAALRAALDNTAITKDIYGERASASKDVLPAGMLPAGAAPDVPQLDPAKLAAALAPLKGKPVVIGWYSDGAMQRLADKLQVQLQGLGLKATTREYKPALLFSLPGKPKDRPDLLATVWNPDSGHPNTFPPVYWEKGAPVNVLGCSDTAGDQLIKRSDANPDPAASQQLTVQAMASYRASNCWLNISDVRDTIVGAANLTGWGHEDPWVYMTNFATLKPRG
jgi:peptide/nickel transport system substrate-binding protein